MVAARWWNNLRNDANGKMGKSISIYSNSLRLSVAGRGSSNVCWKVDSVMADPTCWGIINITTYTPSAAAGHQTTVRRVWSVIMVGYGSSRCCCAKLWASAHPSFLFCHANVTKVTCLIIDSLNCVSVRTVQMGRNRRLIPVAWVAVKENTFVLYFWLIRLVCEPN